MLDAQSSFEVSAMPGVRFFRDSDLPQGFYAVAPPCLALDDIGMPQLGLIVYGHKEAHRDDLQVHGGVLTLTTTLALDRRQERAAQIALAKWMRTQAGADETPPPDPMLLAVDWLGGEVDVSLTESLTLSGKVAGVGGLRCSLQKKLDADSARALQKAWEAGLPKASILYRMQARTQQGPTSWTLQGPSSLSSDALQRCMLVVGM